MPDEHMQDDASNDPITSIEPSDPPNQTPPKSSPADDTDSEARMMAALSHGLGIIAPIAAPLIIWIVRRDDLPQIDRPCKEALNFQIFWCVLFLFIAAPTTCIPFFGCLGVPVLGLLALGVFIMQIIATVAESEGKPYRYPLNVRIL